MHLLLKIFDSYKCLLSCLHDHTTQSRCEINNLLTLTIFINHLLSSAIFFSIHRPLCSVVKGAGRTGITRFSINHPSSDRISGMLPPALTRHVPAWSLKEWVPSGTKGRGTHVTYAGHESGHSQRHRLTMTDNCLHEFCSMFTVVHWFAILRKIKRGMEEERRSYFLFIFCLLLYYVMHSTNWSPTVVGRFPNWTTLCFQGTCNYMLCSS